ncbi:MAG: hypothetical protein VYC17_06145, partial [Nitrospinota bacterium]|nr:hypothetical protein [Nitrospinota bacterium]
KAVLVGYGILKKMLGNPGARDDGYSPLVSIDPFHQGKLNDTTGLDYILKTRKLLEERQSELVVFIIPKSFMIGQYRSCPYSEEVCQEIQEHKRLQRSITRWLGDHGVEFIDPTDKMIELERNGVRLYFEQDEHWNQQGHKAAAEILHRYLRDRVA